MATTPKKPATRKRRPAASKALALKGSKLEDFLPLLPAEEKLRVCAAAGDDCETDDFDGNRPNKATKLNTIRGEFLRYMILGGCEKSPVAKRGLSLKGAWIKCADNANLLDLESAVVTSELVIISCRIDGELLLRQAKTKSITLDNTKVSGLFGDGLKAQGFVFLRDGFESDSEVRLIGARLSNDLDCRSAVLLDEDNSLTCDGMNASGSIYMNGEFRAAGYISLIGAKVDGDLNCKNASLEAGLSAQNAAFGDNVWLDENFSTADSVSLRNARIGGNLYCMNSSFLSPDNSIIANRAKIDGDVDLGNLTAKGTIAFTGSEIGGDFMPQGAVLDGTPALQLRNTKIGGTLIWRGLGFVDGEVDLSGASCETLNTGNTSWLRKREKYKTRDEGNQGGAGEGEKKNIEYHTKLDNFTYNGFSNLPDNCKSEYWIEWLKQQPDEHLDKKFKPRPWEQLAGVLDSMGYEEEARDVRVEKQKLQTSFMINHEEFGFSFRSMWHWLQIFFRYFFWGPLVSYGYRPGNALVWLLGFIIIGTIIYDQAAKRGVMTPTHPLVYKEARANGTIPGWCAENWVYFPDESCAAAMPSEYSEFQSFIYAADVALPVVNLRMEDDWAPRVVYLDGTRDNFGWWVRIFEWILIAAGWILSLLFVSAVGSSIRG